MAGLDVSRVASRGRTALVLSLALAACGGDGGGGPGPTGPSRTVTTVEIAGVPAALVSFGETAQLDVVVRDQAGSAFSDPQVAWTALDPTVLTVGASGLVTAEANGVGRVVASAGAVADTAVVTVNQEIAGVLVFPTDGMLELPGDTLVAVARAVDARGNDVEGAGPPAWSASGAVSVNDAGRVLADGFGFGVVAAEIDGVSGDTSIDVIGDEFFLSRGVALRYELDLPGGPGGPFPALAFVHGSGMVNRNTQRGTTDPLVPEGMAVLRYDKRGVGESGGTYVNVGVANSASALGTLAEDAANAARFLARLPQIDPERVGLLGNSQGGWIVPMAAVMAPGTVRYIMLWSGPTVSVGLEIYYSQLAEGTGTPLDDVYPQLDSFTGPHGYESLPDIASLDIPGIWLYGELDRSIPMRLDVERLGALADAGKPFEVVTFEFGDHALRDTRTNMFYDVWAEYLRFLRDRDILTE